MTPQFEAACIAAATALATAQDYNGPEEAALVSWADFQRSGFRLGEGMEGDERVTPEDAQNFADWWESLDESQQRIVAVGVTECQTLVDGETNVTIYHDGVDSVAVSLENDMILEALIGDAEECYDIDD